MSNFLSKVLVELKSNESLNKHKLVNMLVESTERSISSGEPYNRVYSSLKEGISTINEHLKNPSLDVMIHQFRENEKTVYSKINEMARIGGLESILKSIKESTAYSNPIISSKVDLYESKLKGSNLEFLIYPEFMKDFSQHSLEKSVKESVNKISKVIESNRSDFEMMFAITQLQKYNSPIYEKAANSLKEMFNSGEYSSGMIKMRIGDLNLPIVESLINSLNLSESSNSFNLGNGNPNVVVSSLIAPAKKLKEGILFYADGRFMRISESKELDGTESEVHINESGFTISTINSHSVAGNHPEFYAIAEAFAKLGFNQVGDVMESSSVRNFKVGIAVDGDSTKVLINGKEVGRVEEVNLTESLIMENKSIRSYMNTVFESFDSIHRFEFIKSIKDRNTLLESLVFNLGENYFLCDKKNQAERVWESADPIRLRDHFLSKHRYDISNLFESEINDLMETRKQIFKRKEEISENIVKLEGAVQKIEEATSSSSIKKEDLSRLNVLKDSINGSIMKLKEEYISLDLENKKMNEKKDQDGDGDNDFDDVKIARMVASGMSKKKAIKKLKSK